MKKLLSVFLVALLLLSVLSGLASCTQPEDAGVHPVRTDGYYPNIKLTLNNLYYVQYDALLDAKMWTMVQNPYMDLIEEQYGIKFKLEIQVNDISVYLEKLGADILTGKFADLACLGDDYFGIPNLKSANQNGLLADLTSFVKGTDERVKPSEDVLELWEQAGEEIFYPGTFDGQIKTLPWVQDARGSANSFIYIREDWLEAVGKQVPTNLDELTDVMRAFKNNIDGAYGLVIGASGMFDGACGIFDMHGVNPKRWYETEEGTLAYGLTNTEPMKAALRVLRDWYVEGLINNDEDNDISVIGSLHYTSQEIMNGKAGMHFGTNSMGFISNTLRKNKDARFVTVPLFAADGYELAIQTDSNAKMFYAVSAKCKYPEAVMKLYNFYVETIIDEDGEYNFYNARSQYENSSGEIVEDYALNQFAPIRTGKAFDIEQSLAVLDQIQTGNSEGLSAGDTVTFENYWDALDNGTNYKNYWTVEMYKDGGVYEQLYDMFENANYSRDKFVGIPSDSMTATLGDIDSTALLDAVAIIKGEQPVEYWDTAVDTWLSTGGQTITDEVNEWYKNITG